MQEITRSLESLNKELNEALLKLGFDSLQKKISQLEAQTLSPTFWNDQKQAQKINQELSKTKSRITPWKDLKKDLEEAIELSGLNDESIKSDLNRQLEKLRTKFNQLKTELLFNGRYDNHDAIVSIFAGAGGSDAQDWAEMLLRMYLRWAESQKLKTVIIEQSSGEEAGIKSVTFEISGDFVYGKLRGEHGVHRLVRLSPFNADNLRQTSFARVEIIPKIDSPDEVQVDDKDLKIDVYRAGGHGGQSVNTTDSAVRITHLPTGIVVAIQNERSQLQNKETAITILRSKLAQLQQEQHLDKISELKGPNEQAAWGNQIRNYVLHPYTMVKDVRTKYETSDVQAVLDGKLEGFIASYQEHSLLA